MTPAPFFRAESSTQYRFSHPTVVRALPGAHHLPPVADGGGGRAGRDFRRQRAHGYVRGSEIDRLYRDLTGGIVMAWKTDELRHSLGLSALGQEITIVGPAGT